MPLVFAFHGFFMIHAQHAHEYRFVSKSGVASAHRRRTKCRDRKGRAQVLRTAARAGVKNHVHAAPRDVNTVIIDMAIMVLPYGWWISMLISRKCSSLFQAVGAFQADIRPNIWRAAASVMPHTASCKKPTHSGWIYCSYSLLAAEPSADRNLLRSKLIAASHAATHRAAVLVAQLTARSLTMIPTAVLLEPR